MTFSFLEKPAELARAGELTNAQLFALCQEYGANALSWRRKFMGLLPEVERRRLYEAHGFNSVFEFAARLGGISEEQVRTALNLSRSFSDKPALKALLESGEVSVHKLVRIQSVATVESADVWAEQAKILPKKTLETLARDERGLPGQPVSLQLNESVKKRLEELQLKGLDVNALLTEFLDKREAAIEKEKTELADLESAGRYMPVAVRRVLTKEHGKKCSIPGCEKPSKEIHHARRFAISRSHDPHYLAPLCREHHQLAHLVDQGYREMSRR
jgi:hypothetical protein